MTEKPIATPGSDEAKRHKCACDPRTNKRGAGAYVDRKGQTRYVIGSGCPLHGEGSAWSTGDK